MFTPQVYTPSTNFPLFEPNQVLTDTQLNQMRDFLDQQNRFTRTNMIGTGIICGLQAQARFRKNDQTFVINLSAGYGISSIGQLMMIPEDLTLSHCKIYEGFTGEEVPEGYKEWAQYGAEELLTEDEASKYPQGVYTSSGKKEDGKVYPLRGESLDEKILIFYLEKQKEEMQACVVTDCNSPVNNVAMTPRLLLIEKSKFQPLDLCSSLSDALIRIPRLYTVVDAPANRKKRWQEDQEELDCPLGYLKSGSDIDMAYGEIVEGLYPILKSCLEELIDNCAIFLGIDLKEKEIEELFQCLETQIKDRPDPLYDQYHYDYVRDLAETYNELKGLLCKLGKTCFVENTFPCHFFLRSFDEDEDNRKKYCYIDTPGYRHTFHASPAHGALHGDWEKAQCLFYRLILMIRNFCPVASGYKYISGSPIQRDFDIRITPSQFMRDPLGARAVPYYYELDKQEVYEAFLKHWQCEDCCTPMPLFTYYLQDKDLKIPHRHPWRFDPANLERDFDWDAEMFPVPYQKYGFDYDIGSFSFYRIEGHVGKDCWEAEQELNKLKKQYNLDFDVYVVHTQDTLKQESNFQDLLSRNIRLSKGELDFKFYYYLGGTLSEEIINREGLKEEDIEGNTSVKDHYREWRNWRKFRTLHCNITWLQSDYALARQELVSIFNRIQAKLNIRTSIKDSPATGQIPPEIPVHEEIVFQYIENIKNYWLRLDICDFNFRVFLRKYKELLDHVCKLIFERWPYGYGYGEDKDGVYHDLLNLFHSSIFHRIAYTYHTFEYIRAHDLSLLSNFVKKTSGIEHYAGVQPCGTFVMICDPECRPIDEPVIVADFSICGKLECCCEIDPTKIHRPIVALPDFKMVNVDVANTESTVELFLVGNNDIYYDYSFVDENDSQEALEKLKVELVSNYSQRGHELVMVDFGSAGEEVPPIVRYRVNHDLVFPLGQDEEVDSFEYKIFNPKTQESDVGRVSILLKNVEGPVDSGDFTAIVDAYSNNSGINEDISLTLLKVHDSENEADGIATKISSITRGMEIVTFSNLPGGEYAVLGEAKRGNDIWFGLTEEETLDPSNPEVTFVLSELFKSSASFGLRRTSLADKVNMVRNNLKRKPSNVKLKAPKLSKAKVDPPKSAVGLNIPKAEAASSVDTEKLIKERGIKFKQALFALNKDNTFKGVSTYTKALNFIDQKAADTKDFNKEFTSLAKSLADKSTSGTKKNAYKAAYEIVVHHYLDQVVASETGSLSEESNTALLAIVEQVKEKRLGLSRIRQNWAAKDLKTGEKAAVVDQIEKHLK